VHHCNAHWKCQTVIPSCLPLFSAVFLSHPFYYKHLPLFSSLSFTSKQFLRFASFPNSHPYLLSPSLRSPAFLSYYFYSSILSQFLSLFLPKFNLSRNSYLSCLILFLYSARTYSSSSISLYTRISVTSLIHSSTISFLPLLHFYKI
jgi:hypothetical protein